MDRLAKRLMKIAKELVAGDSDDGLDDVGADEITRYRSYEWPVLRLEVRKSLIDERDEGRVVKVFPPQKLELKDMSLDGFWKWAEQKLDIRPEDWSYLWYEVPHESAAVVSTDKDGLAMVFSFVLLGAKDYPADRDVTPSELMDIDGI